MHHFFGNTHQTWKHVEYLQKDGNINTFISNRLILQQLLKQKDALHIQNITFVYYLFTTFLLTENACRHLGYLMPT